ncbi:MAG: beta-N-acetylhexosaminidase [Candidatus Accumulibacter sp.]|jgi:beta-N-acetylhexosaminidase|nr:beta-N-acetylhexosaminidase [Accumulibacter sp.]
MNTTFEPDSHIHRPRGPLMIDIAGLELDAGDRERLLDPNVGGLILFARNYHSPEQLLHLTRTVHALRSPPLLIAIDHEGGRVQRCRDGFTRIPPMRRIGCLWQGHPQRARDAAYAIGFVLAAELRACGVDLSFTPVLDLDWGRSAVIGDRAFHSDPEAVVQLAGALIAGLRRAGMAACGKHFPGHGWAEADSHTAIPVDERALDDMAADLAPYRRLALDAIMPAHVIYSSIDDQPSGFSAYWHAYLRNILEFDGAVFSDDLSMEGACVAGDGVARARAAWEAGCDMLPVCNAPGTVDELLCRWSPSSGTRRRDRVEKLMPMGGPGDFRNAPEYRDGVDYCRRLNED